MRLPAEWEPQSGVMLTWPDAQTPWEALEKVQQCYAKIIAAIQHFSQTVVLVIRNEEELDVLAKAADEAGVTLNGELLYILYCDMNDTWARDHGPISVHGENGEKYILDFVFNGWGLKFASDLDNQITIKMHEAGMFGEDVTCLDMRPFVLEGGSIDCDGQGTLLTTEECLTSMNRNEYLTKEEIEQYLKNMLGLNRVIWLQNGAIAGDDTDGHVDILARFCSPDTIAYSSCDDPSDENYQALKDLEEELKGLRTSDGKPYKLIPLPIPPAMYLDGYRLPASYANFLIVNGGVLMPGSGCKEDEFAAAQLQKAFPDREIVTIDCTALLSGHGGLHCVTMQLPKGWL